MRLTTAIAIVILVFVGPGAVPIAAQDVYVGHGLAMHGDLKYGPGFTHFDYANPDAPKGGEVRLYTIGSYDSLNPYILNGQSAAGIGYLFETLMTNSSDDFLATSIKSETRCMRYPPCRWMVNNFS